MARLRFSLDAGAPTPFGPRTGMLVLSRPSGASISLPTPTLLTTTSRGVVPHLTRSHVRSSSAIGLVHVPFETFLEQSPPVPTLQPGPNALHRFLGFDVDRHIVSMSIRDPDDTREMPPNGNQHLNAYSLRGVRKVAPGDWTTYVRACTPDIVVALSDTPHTASPFSQKRLTKSIERSTTWLAALLAPNTSAAAPAILVHLAGSASHPARAAFSASLTEPLSTIDGLPTYDAGVAGYTVDLKPLRLAIAASSNTTQSTTPSLLHTSLSTLPPTKPRFAHGTTGPHDMLRLICDVGIDVLDARWAIDAASCGVALDFVFPVPEDRDSVNSKKKKEIGHNLYDTIYRLDFSPLSDSFIPASSQPPNSNSHPTICPCIACSPHSPTQRIVHGPFEVSSPPSTTHNPPYTRAYLHHLLHTHEMSAHSLLVAHNLAVVSSLLDGVRGVLSSPSSPFADQVQRFEDTYRDIDPDPDLAREANSNSNVIQQARTMWADVERARGKGRLKREKEKEEVGAGEGAEELKA
ncbi:hypothetical protein C0995_007399 [Termitomyces sp. Mi166|nr:hypothetical protein C0995_007399 [Termitomyces sp. Mi166\